MIPNSIQIQRLQTIFLWSLQTKLEHEIHFVLTLRSFARTHRTQRPRFVELPLVVAVA